MQTLAFTALCSFTNALDVLINFTLVPSFFMVQRRSSSELGTIAIERVENYTLPQKQSENNIVESEN